VSQALSLLAGTLLSPESRERVIVDTLRPTLDAKQAWTESGLIG
jgi:hypothetical protein